MIMEKPPSWILWKKHFFSAADFPVHLRRLFDPFG